MERRNYNNKTISELSNAEGEQFQKTTTFLKKYEISTKFSILLTGILVQMSPSKLSLRI